MTIIVDIRNNIGTIKIIKVQSNEYLSNVKLENNGYLILIP
jgi:hypothetical protein